MTVVEGTKWKVIDEHTIDIDLLGGGYVLDIGCGNCEFAKELINQGCKVIGVDPDKRIVPLVDPSFVFIRKAVVAKGVAAELDYVSWVGIGSMNFVMTNDIWRAPKHWSIDYVQRRSQKSKMYKVETETIESIQKRFSIDCFDAVKLDIEGGEYDILLDWPGPIAKQISVEFHDMLTGANPGGLATHERILSHLSQWYDFVKSDVTTRNFYVPNMWDALYVLK